MKNFLDLQALPADSHIAVVVAVGREIDPLLAYSAFQKSETFRDS